MITHIIFTIILLLYCNVIRYYELKHYRILHSRRQYWMQLDGIEYSITIALISFIMGILKQIP